MATHNFTGTVTDPLNAISSDGYTLTSSGTAGVRIVKRSFLGHRVNWGMFSDVSTQGPTFSNVTPEPYVGLGPPNPITVAHTFSLLAPARINSCRIYKAPAATGTIPVNLWAADGTVLASATLTWAADAGGWRTVTFTPVTLAVDVDYHLGYYSPSGVYAYSSWVFNGQDTVVWPIVQKSLFESGGVKSNGNGYNLSAGGIVFPNARSASSYYIDVQVEWDDTLPGYSSGDTYFDQWTHATAGRGRFAFPVGVYNADPPNYAGYMAIGVNTLNGGEVTEEKVAAVKAAGLDWWPYIGQAIGAETGLDMVRAISDDNVLAAQVPGYQLDDEPDMSNPYRSPALLREWANTVRRVDSTRPIWLNMGKWTVLNQGFAWSPQGASPQLVNQLWREWADMGDIISCDFYTLSTGDDPNNRYGVWVYAEQVARMRELVDDKRPVWAIVESTSQTPNMPTPDNVRKAVWACLIAGARGIIFFDHRFASDFVTQDFAAILNNVPMKNMVQALTTRLQSLGNALYGSDLALVSSAVGNNTTAGPKGGTYGVPVHYTTRADASHQYLFAQAIRPGTTTCTFTIPAWAGLTLTVLDESRTISVSSGGVLVDTFAADYTFHLYQR